LLRFSVAPACLVACDTRVAKLLFYLGQASPYLCQLTLAGGAYAFDELDLAAHTRAAEIKLAGELLEGVTVALALQTVDEGMVVRIAASTELWPTDACAAARHRQVLSGHDSGALKRMLPEEQVDADPQTGGPSQLGWRERRLISVDSERKQHHGIAASTYQLRFKALQLACAAHYDHLARDRRILCRPAIWTTPAVRRDRVSGRTFISGAHRTIAPSDRAG
jgi:hypothetical protein